MKRLAFIGALILILLFGGLTWYDFFKEQPFKVPDGMTLVSNSFIDSLQAVANKPPDTTEVEKIVIQEKVVTVVRDSLVPVYVDPATGEKIYIDSLKMIDDGINAWVEIMSQGIVNQITWGYKPVYKTITREITVPKPYPVDKIVYEPQRGLYLNGGVGAGVNTAGFSFGLMWQQRNGLMYGAEMVQFDTRYYMLKVGYKIF